jgi:uncharacterized protein
VRIWLQHGDELTRRQMLEQAKRYQVQVCIFGHTHIPELAREEGVLLFNPGSPSLPKAESPSVGILDTGERIARIYALPGGEILAEQGF